jgi:DNA-directed RNA polymerase specialized sigma24 family protein
VFAFSPPSLWLALQALTQEDYRAVVLRVEVGLGYQDVAIELGKPSADAARMAVKRAIERLMVEMKRLQRSAAWAWESTHPA